MIYFATISTIEVLLDIQQSLGLFSSHHQSLRYIFLDFNEAIFKNFQKVSAI